MAQHTTCYVDTFITVAPDSTATTAIVPPVATTPSVAARTFAMLDEAYRYDSDEVIFTVWADRRDIPEAERPAARDAFFSKGQACLRASDLAKRYGWGIHFDARGRVALYPVGSDAYESFAAGVSPLDGRPVDVIAAMRSSRRPKAV